jgi:hypothetical protein
MPKKSDSRFLLRNCKFGYQCPALWEELASTKRADVRFCGKCDRKVHFCETDSELREAIENNRCVALWRRQGMLLGYIDPTER